VPIAKEDIPKREMANPVTTLVQKIADKMTNNPEP
jgi:hypothetical protein